LSTQKLERILPLVGWSPVPTLPTWRLSLDCCTGAAEERGKKLMVWLICVDVEDVAIANC
jgi:hypothetical protein